MLELIAPMVYSQDPIYQLPFYSRAQLNYNIFIPETQLLPLSK